MLILKFLSDYKYTPDSQEFKDYYLSHPNYPSLYAITDTLDYFNVENLAVKVELEQFDELPEKLIAVIKTENDQQEFVYVKARTGLEVTYITENDHTITVKKTDFLKTWQLIVLAIEENPSPSTEKTKKKPALNWNLLFIPLLLFSGILGYHFNYTFFDYSYITLTIIGLYSSILLIQKNNNPYEPNELTSKICKTNDYGDDSCLSIIRSDGAKLPLNFTLSDLSFVFFITLFIFLNLNLRTEVFCIVISTFAIPIIGYSLWYQGLKHKKWCTLCLIIVLTLIGFILTSVLNLTLFNFEGLILPSIIFLTLFVSIGIVWKVTSPILSGYFLEKANNTELLKLKRNPIVFQSLANETDSIQVDQLKNIPKLFFGDQEASISLDLFLSPSCPHCHTVFLKALDLLKRHPKKLKLNIGFNINIANTQNVFSEVAKIITNTYLNKGPEPALDLLHSWHGQTINLPNFIKTHNQEISEKAIEYLTLQHLWCNKNNLNYAPVTIFNNQLFPKTYDLTDINYLINSISQA